MAGVYIFRFAGNYESSDRGKKMKREEKKMPKKCRKNKKGRKKKRKKKKGRKKGKKSGEKGIKWKKRTEKEGNIANYLLGKK